MEYLIDGKKYSLDYKELKDKYEEFSGMSDEDFLLNLGKIAHLACIVCWIKGLGTTATISDEGIVHELIHLIDGTKDRNDLTEIRGKFNELVKLA